MAGGHALAGAASPISTVIRLTKPTLEALAADTSRAYLPQMAEDFDPALLSADKATRYAELAGEIGSVLEGEPNTIARMATLASMLHHAFDAFFWTGFYVVDQAKGDELMVGPYQGTLGCLRIPFGRGVCGRAAAERRTIIVKDVNAFADHIACDARSKSEVVLPVFDHTGSLIAVLDVDSDRASAFDEIDASGLQAILAASFSKPF